MTTGLDETILINSLSKQSSHLGSSLLMFKHLIKAGCLAHLKTLAKSLMSECVVSATGDDCLCKYLDNTATDIKY